MNQSRGRVPRWARLNVAAFTIVLPHERWRRSPRARSGSGTESVCLSRRRCTQQVPPSHLARIHSRASTEVAAGTSSTLRSMASNVPGGLLRHGDPDRPFSARSGSSTSRWHDRHPHHRHWITPDGVDTTSVTVTSRLESRRRSWRQPVLGGPARPGYAQNPLVRRRNSPLARSPHDRPSIAILGPLSACESFARPVGPSMRHRSGCAQPERAGVVRVSPRSLSRGPR
jgi:hypothetical protein